MRRSICFVLALLVACAAWAAPVPPPFTKGWDKPLDPDNDCKFIRDKGALTVELPGTYHDYDPLRKSKNAPRLLRSIEGDFVMQVRVRVLGRPSVDLTAKGQVSSVTGGFLLIPPNNRSVTCIRFGFGVAGEGRGADGYVVMKHQGAKGGRSDGIWNRGWGGHWPLPEKASEAYLQWERRDGKFYPSLSADGKKWTLLHGPMEFGGLSTKVKIGLAAYSSSAEPAKVRFDHFKLTQGQKKER